VRDYDIATGALDAIENEGCTTDDQIETLRAFVDLFKPYSGDDRSEAIERKITNCRCGNCDYVSAAFATPSELGGAASTGLRRAICPRCYSTEMYIGDAK